METITIRSREIGETRETGTAWRGSRRVVLSLRKKAFLTAFLSCQGKRKTRSESSNKSSSSPHEKRSCGALESETDEDDNGLEAVTDGGDGKSRPNFFLVSSCLSTICVRSDILPGYKTDHSLVALGIDNKTNPRGPGFWKLNTSFLLEAEYVNMIKETISEVSSEYLSNDDVDAVLLWDTIKMKIRGKSIEYAKRKRR